MHLNTLELEDANISNKVDYWNKIAFRMSSLKEMITST